MVLPVLPFEPAACEFCLHLAEHVANFELQRLVGKPGGVRSALLKVVDRRALSSRSQIWFKFTASVGNPGEKNHFRTIEFYCRPSESNIGKRVSHMQNKICTTNLLVE